ncbi:SGNH/GDSL hydrolase family protein [Actinoplanes sp. TRM 88003]|uniref:SGNH/GDSL hydrolase family protein n=1 Tax=Paractinoplanes aksuensis TaxID=2939490 RepID=A0ABT1E1X7_9ACTN|nr:SGNH/GDSL hydrolase family protein [Actinoplanes aksuensis]MCO8276838.1 SGNH/GDSL hydrolase family protein [Actinoplanes aksuensis]
MTIRRALAAALVLTATLFAPATPASASAPAGPLKVMPLGDSITWGSGSADSRVGNRTGARTASGYRIDLQKRLAAAGLDVDFVGSQQAGPAGTDRDNEGHPGWRIDQIAANVDNWLATYQPDVVLLHIGTNDMAQNRSVAATTAGLSALIDRIRAARPDAAIFVQQLVQGHGEPYRSRIAAYNATIPGLLAAKDDNVYLVDQSSIGGLSTFDNLHPNDNGYAKMAYNLYQALATVLPGGDTWPTGTNPYDATTATLCFRINQTVAGRQTWHADCSRWTLRTVWQRPGTVTQTYLVRIKARYVTTTIRAKVKGKPQARRVTRLVAARYIPRTRLIPTWLSDDPYLTNAAK